MAGRASAKFQISVRRAGGFSLIEVLIVVLIMGIVLGVTGSLLGGFYSMFQASEDQSSARMRAQAVFNILSVPIQGAGIGIPSNDIGSAFTFGAVSFGMRGWRTPLSISRDVPGATEGNQLRVIYGVPAGLKYVGKEIKGGTQTDIAPDNEDPPQRVSFTRQIGNKQFSSTTGASKIDPYDITWVGGSNGATSALLAFPGTDMMSVMVTDGYPASQSGDAVREVEFETRRLYYEPPLLNNETDEDRPGFRSRNANTIRTNHDIFLMRGGWAYVDVIGRESTFCFLNIYDNDTFDGVTVPPSATDPAFSGFMIEGIAGIWFDTETGADMWRFVRVEVLAEGDTMDEGRDASRAALEGKWGPRGVTLRPGVFYEEFSRVFRPRNLQR
ncbi:MAG: prepilin-type N-terminal cleavage/methylation domain-containing protein [Synergistaceae bacterium]|nr:prepilin-type N-terminal cleavage/methylation domain-containing protein [Synergistaceae bacterium]